MTEPPALPEVVEEVHQPELCQQISNLLAARVLGVYDVGSEVPYHYSILVPEACQGLLQVRQMFQGVGQEVRANDQGQFHVSDNLSSHHVCTTEARCLYATALGSIPDDHAYSPLRIV